MTAYVGPANATDKTVLWVYDPNKITLTQSKDTLTATVKVARSAQAGTTTITIRANSDNTKSSSCTVTIKAVADGNSGNQGGNEQTECMHNWNAGVITKKPTETEDGVKTFTCIKCFKTRTEAIPALGHSHTIETEWTYDDTYHWHKADCGIESHNEIKGEHWLDTRIEEATCDKEGAEETYCTVCKKVTATKAIAKTEHSWCDTITKEPTESEDGESIWTCEKCGEEKTVVMPALGHNHIISDDWRRSDTHHWHEANCGIESHNTDKAEHTWVDPIPLQPDELSYDSLHYKTCAVCGGDFFEDHEKETRIIQEGTCTQNKIEETYCTLCNMFFGRYETPAFGHSSSLTYKNDEHDHWKLCVRCDEIMNKTEHNIRVFLTDNGEMEKRCSDCNYVIPDSMAAWTSETLSELHDALHRYVPQNYPGTPPKTVTIKVVGEISESDLTKIDEALTKLIPPVTYTFLLDLSKTTGITEITKKTAHSFVSGHPTDIVIPNSVTTIGDNAFSSHNSIKNVIIPNSVTTIGKFVFSGCTGLESATIQCSRIESGMFLNCENLTSVTILDGVTSIGASAFHNCTSLSSVTIPGSVTSIGDSAFSSCTNLESVTILDGVTSIGDSAFSSCTNLESVTILDGVTSIGDSAFSGCTSLASVTIPGSVTSIGNSAFNSCTSLSSVIIPDGVTSIGSSAFKGCTSFSSVTIPGSVTSIGYSAFSGCTDLASVTILKGVTSIEFCAFNSCTSLSSVIIPDSVTSIGDSAFSSCTKLESVTIPDSVTSIGDSAFSGCTSLASVTILDGVTSIGEYAFVYCESLASVTIPDSITSIGKYAFWYLNFVNKNLKTIYYKGTRADWEKIDIDASSFPSGIEINCTDGTIITV